MYGFGRRIIPTRLEEVMAQQNSLPFESFLSMFEKALEKREVVPILSESTRISELDLHETEWFELELVWEEWFEKDPEREHWEIPDSAREKGTIGDVYRAICEVLGIEAESTSTIT